MPCLLLGPVGEEGNDPVDLEAGDLPVDRVFENTKTGDPVWTIGVSVLGFAAKLILVVLNEADAFRDL